MLCKRVLINILIWTSRKEKWKEKDDKSKIPGKEEEKKEEKRDKKTVEEGR